METSPLECAEKFEFRLACAGLKHQVRDDSIQAREVLESLMANVEASPVDPRQETFKLSDAAVGRPLRSVRGFCFAASDGECLATSALAGL